MRLLSIAILAAGLSSFCVEGKVTVASQSKARMDIFTQPGATPPEVRAAKELAEHLRKITGAAFAVKEAGKNLPRRAILVGPGSWAAQYFPEVPLMEFGDEEMAIKTKGQRLLLAGGRPRGTMYAVSRFLQVQCGVRWWSPWAADVPKRPTLKLDELNVRAKPAFEYREPFWFPAFDGDWAARHAYNGQTARLTDEMGGKIQYRGFVHTFYPLVPPEEHFSKHPEWYSLIKGKRTTDHAQLCTSNPELRDFVVDRVRQWLKESPQARIISVSQNDWYGACECEKCKAIDDAEGSHAGTMLALVNYVAEKLEKEFPQVAFDTLAYQYTRKAPKTIKPRPNVIVRLCSIECNFGEPLEAPVNQTFARDIQDWSKICQRLYIWDYTTDFAHYVQPHPNWFSLGPNVRFFHNHGVRGLFEQGAYQSQGSEMAELRAWVLAQLLWNPNLDDRKLINEFLEGYYGVPAAGFIRQYFDLLYQASRGWNLTCFSRTDTPFHKFQALAEAERLWQKAEKAAARDPDLLWRVRIAHLPVRYVWLSRWADLRKECKERGADWPLAASRKTVADEWLALATGKGPAGWSKMTHLNESGLSPETFIARFAQDPPE